MENVSYTYKDVKGSNSHPALRNLTFSVWQGESVAVVGSNGSGKSTLARLLWGFLTPDEGRVVFSPCDGSGAATVPLGMVFQSPRDQIVLGLVGRDTAFGPENLGLSENQINSRVQQQLTLVNLIEKIDDKTASLSLGQKQKLATAGIFALSPEILLLDEASSMIDPVSRKNLLTVISQWKTPEKTLITITHDLDEALSCSRIIELQEGCLMYDGAAAEWPEQENWQQLSLPSKPEIHTKDQQSEKKIGLQLANISFSHTDKPFFSDFSLCFEKGTLTALMGVSGSGKSTLMELASGLLAAQSGQILAAERPLLALQDSENALFEEFAADDVAYGPQCRKVEGDTLLSQVRAAMNCAGLPFKEFADRRTATLSGGQKRKLSLAGILAIDSSVYLFDEPTAGLDVQSRAVILSMLRQLAAKGNTVVFSTHRHEEADSAQRVIVLENAQVVSDTAPVLPSESSFSSTDSTDSTGLAVFEPLEQVEALHRLNHLSMGMYQKISSPVHRLNPVLKYLCMLGLVCLGIIPSSLTLLLSAVAISLLYALLAAYPLLKILNNLIKILPWLAVFFFFQMALFPVRPGDVVYFSFGFLSISGDKLHLGLATMLHYVAVLIPILVFVYSTDEAEILQGMKGLLKPLAAVKVPVRHIVLIVGIIFRFIPLLTEEALLILKAQAVRSGGKLGRADKSGKSGKKKFSPFKTIRALLPIFIPLVIQTLKRAEALSDALDTRYYK